MCIYIYTHPLLSMAKATSGSESFWFREHHFSSKSNEAKIRWSARMPFAQSSHVLHWFSHPMRAVVTSQVSRNQCSEAPRGLANFASQFSNVCYASKASKKEGYYQHTEFKDQCAKLQGIHLLAYPSSNHPKNPPGLELGWYTLTPQSIQESDEHLIIPQGHSEYQSFALKI